MNTPCINICKMTNDRCAGCNRTLEQIASWTKYNDQQRQLIMEQLKNEKNSRS